MNATPNFSFKQLRVWQDAVDLVVSCYERTSSFPVAERFGLQQQMRRSAVSIPANIAEGHARRGPGEFLHFISIALGSQAELETLIEISRRLDLLNEVSCQGLLTSTASVGRQLHGLEAAIERKRRS